MTSQQLKERILNEFPILEGRQNGSQTSFLREARLKAFENFKSIGFPEKKHEEWKYTNLEKVLKHDYRIFTTENEIEKKAEGKLKQFMNNFEDCFVFVNGRYSPTLSKGKTFTSFLFNGTNFSGKTKDYFERYFAKILPSTESFSTLNTALAEFYYLIDIPPDFSHPSPLFLIHVTDSGLGAVMNNSRFLVHTGRNSVCPIVEYFIQEGQSPALSNRVAEIHCEENSSLNHTIIQDPDEENLTESNLITYTGFKVDKNASLNAVTLTLSGAFTRNNLMTCLSGFGANAKIYGLYLLSGNRMVDNHTLVDHAVPLCDSDELYKGVLNDTSKGVFNGKIIVRKDAQKTVAYQSNRNLLLSDHATINTKPQLEIFADDVKCSHGATSGQLDEQALFYLRSRGIGKTEARDMLVSAFAGEIISKIQYAPLREFVEKRLGIGN